MNPLSPPSSPPPSPVSPAPHQQGEPSSPATTTVNRQASIDVFRGIVMFLMLAEVLHLSSLQAAYPDSGWAGWLSFHTSHVAWVGCSLHDMIQPSFSFLVGVSLPFSILSRKRRGSSWRSMALHAAWRSIVLIVLGILLRSLGRPSTNFFFVDTLTQIGLGYFFLFLIAGYSRTIQLMSGAAVLVAYWLLFALWPLPPADFDWPSVGVPAHWEHLFTGFEAHWNKNTNPAAAFDTWFMNLFPQHPTFEYNSGGYCVLNFIPTWVTMLIGVLAGGILVSSSSPTNRLTQLFALGIVLMAAGWGISALGWCPIVKRIWTPTWVLYSGGLCLIALSALYGVCDLQGHQKWAWPLLVIGSNSIVAYVMSWTLEEPIKAFWKRHLGAESFEIWGDAWEPFLLGSTVLLSMWLILLWLKSKRIYIRI
ncbi:acyltransferase family protein [Aureliella helgolandensis]|uniref:DUF5009 domain-containing protein n=1 Tax=Aureliella helgolandensis TaxID=2527968 RepID=A0A518GCK4_9BACT|nr:hypothetical protein [Aureliella helgolandensis]QDV26332.1 hypothetical protein Q31a_47040 [Aureliella helgolandensis]